LEQQYHAINLAKQASLRGINPTLSFKMFPYNN